MKMEKLIPTSLSKAQDVGECLNWKLSTLNDENKQFALVDYIGRTFGELEALKAYFKDQVKQNQADVKKIEAQESLVKDGVYTFLTENGMTDKEDLKGKTTSSIKLNDATEDTISTKREFELLVDKAEMEDILIGLGVARYVDKDVVKKGKSASITIFKRKVIVPEIEE